MIGENVIICKLLVLELNNKGFLASVKKNSMLILCVFQLFSKIKVRRCFSLKVDSSPSILHYWTVDICDKVSGLPFKRAI
jgi:hypothetical protein